jgi:S-methylmethionine-dependent homocysteine/selenocysteine methylase
VASSVVLRLDGGLATELQRQGQPVRPPWWTSAALRTRAGRRVLARTHAAYRAAGAQVLTANTFRTSLRALRRAGATETAAVGLVRTAVGLAQAAATGGVAVAGSIAPVEDCYDPGRVPADAELRAEHGWLARQLVAAGVDLVLIETVNTVREARVALEQALGAGARTVWVSFVCTGRARLLSGESVAAAGRAVERSGASAVLVNCTPPAETGQALGALRDACAGPVGAYPNLEDRAGVPDWTHVDAALRAAVGPAGFAECALAWRDEIGASVLGGCCGTTPRHIAALADALAG